MTNILKTLALATTLLAAPAIAQTLPAPVIVIVDMEEIISSSAAGKQAQGELKTRFDGIQARLQSLRTQYGAEEQALLKTRPTAPGPAATAWETKARDMQTRKTKDEQDLAKRNQDFEAARQNVLRQINEGAQPIISTVMRERGASIVLAEGATLQHTAALDITKDVVARFDKAMPRVSAAPPAAAPAPAAK